MKDGLFSGEFTDGLEAQIIDKKKIPHWLSEFYIILDLENYFLLHSAQRNIRAVSPSYGHSSCEGPLQSEQRCVSRSLRLLCFK